MNVVCNIELQWVQKKKLKMCIQTCLHYFVDKRGSGLNEGKESKCKKELERNGIVTILGIPTPKITRLRRGTWPPLIPPGDTIPLALPCTKGLVVFVVG
jgi:hypothetical protein